MPPILRAARPSTPPPPEEPPPRRSCSFSGAAPPVPPVPPVPVQVPPAAARADSAAVDEGDGVGEVSDGGGDTDDDVATAVFVASRGGQSAAADPPPPAVGGLYVPAPEGGSCSLSLTGNAPSGQLGGGTVVAAPKKAGTSFFGDFLCAGPRNFVFDPLGGVVRGLGHAVQEAGSAATLVIDDINRRAVARRADALPLVREALRVVGRLAPPLGEVAPHEQRITYNGRT
eukprot:5694380-Prymnesium_polylepis.1